MNRALNGITRQFMVRQDTIRHDRAECGRRLDALRCPTAFLVLMCLALPLVALRCRKLPYHVPCHMPSHALSSPSHALNCLIYCRKLPCHCAFNCLVYTALSQW